MSQLIKLSAGALALSLSSFGAIAQSTAPSRPLDTSSADDATELAKKLQNPIGDLYSFPFQNNTNFNTGPHKGTQDILNVQPVIPIHINYGLERHHADDSAAGLAAVVPAGANRAVRHRPDHVLGVPLTGNPVNGWLWGVGPVIQIPTISDKSLGSNVWGGGPTGVLVYMKGPWVAGVLANNVWSFGGTSGLGGTRYNTFLTQPFVNYNFGEGWYVGSAPIITANWLTAGDKAWTLPIGAQVGRVMKIGGKLPVNFLIGAYYNALRPQFGSTWQLRTQVTLIF